MENWRKHMWYESISSSLLLVGLLKNLRIRNREAHRFGADKAQYYTLHMPKREQKRTLVVYIHGGGWRQGSAKLFAAVGDFFADEGYITAVLGYRKSPKNKYPCQIEDVAKGLANALDVIREKGIEIDKIVVSGSSAGAQLGAVLCLNKALHKRYGLNTGLFQGFCSLSGPLSFEDCVPNPFFEEIMALLLPSATEYRVADPITHLSAQNEMNLLCIHGEMDPVVFVKNAEVFYEAFVPAPGFGKEMRIAQNGYHSTVGAGLFYFSSEERKVLLKWLEQFK